MNAFQVIFNNVTFKFNQARNDFVTDSAFQNAKFTVIESVFSKTIDSTEANDTQPRDNDNSTNLHKTYGSLPELDMIDRDTLDDHKHSNFVNKPSLLKKHEHAKKENSKTD